MAVSIDTIYQRVLTLANKEQRGYVTPQEFNLLANQAQMEIFEQYFFDIAKFNAVPGNTQGYSDPLSVLYERVGVFEVEKGPAWMIANMEVPGDTMVIPWREIYKMGVVRVGSNQVEMVNSKDFDAARFSPLTAPTLSRPIGYTTANGLTVAIGKGDFATPSVIDMNIRYIARPSRVEWAYVIVNDKALYNGNTSVDFELHSSEETELVYKILKLAGINLKAQEVVQVGQVLEQTNKQTTL